MRKNNTKPAVNQVPIPPILSLSEAERVAEKLACALAYQTEEIALLLLLINHLETIREDAAEFSLATFSIKQKLFVGTIESNAAQTKFEAKAMMKRGDLLMWPSEKAA